MRVVQVNADHWKSWLHARLTTPIAEPGAMTLFDGPPMRHADLARHLVAERHVEQFKPGKGVFVTWERVHRANHWLDAGYNACAAGHFAGVRLLGEDELRSRVGEARSLSEFYGRSRRRRPR